MEECNLVEFFSGIGSQAKALKNLNIKIKTLATCEWDVHAFVAYDAIHNSTNLPANVVEMQKDEVLEKLKNFTLSNDGKERMDFRLLKSYSIDALRRIYAAIIRSNNFVDISSLRGDSMPNNIDVLTYSFPCQDLSNVGAFHGYNKGIDKDSGSRSSLLWQVGRILSEMEEKGKKLPRYLLMENVPTLLASRHFDNFKKWISDLENLGYESKYFQLNASSFGQPQNRPRLLMLSVLVESNARKKIIVKEYFASKNAVSIVNDYKKSPYYNPCSVMSMLRTDYDNPLFLSEALESTPNDTVSRRKIWKENPQIVLPGNVYNESIDMIRTITTKQDRNPNSGNVYFDSGIEGKSKFRYLTPRECMLFMGFSDEDYDNVKAYDTEFHKGDKLFPRDKIIRMAGNSIPIKLLEGMFWQMLLLDEKLKKQ